MLPAKRTSPLLHFESEWPTRAARVPTLALLLVTFVFIAGCVGREIRVSPVPDKILDQPVPVSARVHVTAFEKHGPGLMPGIAFLDWSRENLQETILRYLQQRQTFIQVSAEGGEVEVLLKVILRMESWDRYFYNVDITAELTAPDGTVAKSYTAHAREPGTKVRFTPASDEPPIEKALAGALNQLCRALDADRDLFLAQRRQEHGDGR